MAEGMIGRLIDIGDTALHVVERGEGIPLLVLHGGPGLDHRMFGDYLDPLAERHRLILVDQRAQGRSAPAGPATWSVERSARDVSLLAEAMGLGRYVVLGHSWGALVALMHAVTEPGAAAATIVSAGVPSARYLEDIGERVEALEPAELRDRVKRSWADEETAESQEDVERILHDQMPFHFADPRDPRIEEYEARSAGSVYAPEVLRHFATHGYGALELESRLGAVSQPVLVLVGRHDRTTPLAAAEAIAAGIPGAELVVFKHSAHMSFVEETEAYLEVVHGFLARTTGT